MFVQMRRAERALPEEESLELLCCGQYGILSTIGSDGYPYGVPMSYVYKNHKILLHSAGEGHKISNLTFSDKVSFCVVGNTKPLPDKFSVLYKSVIAFGRIRQCTDDEKLQVLLNVLDKYSPDHKEKGIQYAKTVKERVRGFCIEIECLTGKARKQ